jgi:hypothetical protein
MHSSRAQRLPELLEALALPPHRLAYARR